MRALNLTAKLKDAANASAPELSFQRKAVQDFHARQGLTGTPLPVGEGDQPAAPVESSQSTDSTPAESQEQAQQAQLRSSPVASTSKNKRNIDSVTDEDSDDAANVQPKRRKSLALLNHVSQLTPSSSLSLVARKRLGIASSSQSMVIDDSESEDVDKKATTSMFLLFYSC